MTPAVSLVGFMGAGKSTLGPRLATRLSLPFVDLDQRIVEESGRTIAAIFEQDGEAGFRSIETATLERVLAEGPSVFAPGGGAVESAENRRRLRGWSTVVWLDARLETVRSRLRSARGPARPLLKLLATDEFAQRYRDRRALYAGCAHFRFESDDVAVGDLVRSVVLALRARDAGC